MDKKALATFICSLFIFGSNGITASHINLTSYEIIFMRTLIGSIAIVMLYKLKGYKFHCLEHKRDTIFVAISGAIQGISWVMLYEGYKYVSVGIASLIYYCGPIILMAFSPLLFKEKLTRERLFGFGVVLCGLVLVNGVALGEGTGTTWGFIASILSAVTFFLMLVFNKKSRHIVGMENAVIQVVSAFMILAIYIGVTQHFVIHVHAGDWPWLLIQGVINTALGCYCYFSPLSRLSVQTVAVCGYIEPLSAVIFSAMFLGERMTYVQIIGAICIIGGAMFAEISAQKKLDRRIFGHSIRKVLHKEELRAIHQSESDESQHRHDQYDS